MADYVLPHADENGDTRGIIRTSDGMFIPADIRNRHYRAFLEWQAEGNTPDPTPDPAPATVDLGIMTDEDLEAL